jgi:hypothetical protein
MEIMTLSKGQLLQSTRDALGLSSITSQIVDDALLAASLRRAAGLFCPCPLSSLVATVLESLQYLFEEHRDAAEERVAQAAGELVVGGDLLELNQVTTDDPNAKSSWVFAAPPSFIVTPGRTIFLIGIVPDQSTPLPASLNTRIVYEGFRRLLIPQPGENLSPVLKELGLRELSISAWLTTPKLQSALDLRDAMMQRLKDQPPSGTITEISILDSQRAVDYYSGRWIVPANESGYYVGRRPQAYGAPLWGFANLTNGVVTKFLDFPLTGMQWRGCDAAWHLQMAIDNCRRKPQLYRLRQSSDGPCLDFFSPIPLWAHRRLNVIGHRALPKKCLNSYCIPEHHVASEEEFLKDHLWLARRDQFEGKD